MNRFEEFYKNMNDEEWEKFAVTVLSHVGYVPLTLPAYGTDGGKDFIVEGQNLKFIVSCKHYIKSGRHVGQDDEQNIGDRILQHNVNGFIGFYSTGITSALQNRLDAICNNCHYTYKIFDQQIITHIVQSMDTKILQIFGLYPNEYYMNVLKSEYKPLRCICCGKDILEDQNIRNSITGVAERKDGNYGYVYGCKVCLLDYNMYLGVRLEIEQALHLKLLQGWEDEIDEWINEYGLKIDEDFYKMRYEFAHGVRQKQFPQNEGTWYGIDPDNFLK